MISLKSNMYLKIKALELLLQGFLFLRLFYLFPGPELRDTFAAFFIGEAVRAPLFFAAVLF